MEVGRAYQLLPKTKNSPCGGRAGSQSDPVLAEEGVEGLVKMEVGDLGEDPSLVVYGQSSARLPSRDNTAFQ